MNNFQRVIIGTNFSEIIRYAKKQIICHETRGFYRRNSALTQLEIRLLRSVFQMLDRVWIDNVDRKGLRLGSK